jgi:uncharacterized protein GlcG (DUF336 family)
VLCANEVAAAIEAAATAIDSTTMAVAVTDRVGNILALFREPLATDADAEQAVGLARTASLFSNNRAPLSSRTVRTLSGKNFPPGVRNTPNAALYGIENTNRGCDLNVTYNVGQQVPTSRSAAGIAAGAPCNGLVQDGCGLGIVTGKNNPFDEPPTAVNPGGVPIFRPLGALPEGAVLLGGIGVAGVPARSAEFAAFAGAASGGNVPTVPEVPAVAGGPTSPVPQFPLPPPRNVFIDGIRLPFVEQVGRPSGTAPGPLVGSFDPAFLPSDGQAAPAGYLVGPLAGSQLSQEEVDRIVRQSEAAANRTRAVIRLPVGFCSRMIIAVSDLDGSLLALFRMSDATMFSLDVAAAKARNVVYFSGPGSVDLQDWLTGQSVPPGTAVTNRTLSFAAQPFYPAGINGSPPGPFFFDGQLAAPQAGGLFVRDLENPCSQGSQAPNLNQSGIVFFPGSTPLYRGGTLVGGLGVSGDGVEQDDYVTFLGARGFLPPEDRWAHRVFLRDVRLPFLKFPRSPEGCTP